MSVKFQEQIEQVTRTVSGGPNAGIPGIPGVASLGAAAAAVGEHATKHPVLHEVGEVLTQGGGPGGYLAVGFFDDAVHI
jgi:hypothetical protein